MSKRIQQTLEVIEEARRIFDLEGTSIQEARIRATEIVADRYGLTRTTVEDKFMRWLRPDVEVASDFDRLLGDWFIDDYPVELQRTLLRFARSAYDEQQIEAAFGKVPENVLPEAEEREETIYEDGFEEGRLDLEIHLGKERNQALVKRAKEKWFREQDGNLRCSVCTFSFWDTYGEIGRDYIEAHHTQPISSLTSETVIQVSDLVPVCSNCHSIIHRSRPVLTVDELRNLMTNPR